jgi:hypothetical protein
MSVDLPQMWSTAYATIRVSSCIARRTPSPEIKRASEEARFMSWALFLDQKSIPPPIPPMPPPGIAGAASFFGVSVTMASVRDNESSNRCCTL